MTDLDRLRARVAELEAALRRVRVDCHNLMDDNGAHGETCNEECAAWKDPCPLRVIDAALAAFAAEFPAPSPEAYVKAGIAECMEWVSALNSDDGVAQRIMVHLRELDPAAIARAVLK